MTTTPAPAFRSGRRQAIATILIGIGALLVAGLIEWLGWLVIWRLGTAPRMDAAWWWEFTSGALRTATAAALVAATIVLLLALPSRVRRWLRPRILAVFAWGMGVFLLMILVLTVLAHLRI